MPSGCRILPGRENLRRPPEHKKTAPLLSAPPASAARRVTQRRQRGKRELEERGFEGSAVQ
jgi:hypothetical protein